MWTKWERSDNKETLARKKHIRCTVNNTRIVMQASTFALKSILPSSRYIPVYVDICNQVREIGQQGKHRQEMKNIRCTVDSTWCYLWIPWWIVIQASPFALNPINRPLPTIPVCYPLTDGVCNMWTGVFLCLPISISRVGAWKFLKCRIWP